VWRRGRGNFSVFFDSFGIFCSKVAHFSSYFDVSFSRKKLLFFRIMFCETLDRAKIEVMGRLGPPALFTFAAASDGRAARSGLPALSLGSKKTLQLAISRGANFFTVHKVLE